MRSTLISHVWNEAFLFPYWLRHHYPMFDHGVIIDYGSTDGSMDMVDQLAPGWEVRRSRNQLFDARLNDQEVMDVEQEFDGWKMVLNTTEFLLHPDLGSYLKWMSRYRTDVHGIWALDVVMVDRQEDADQPLTDEPLHFQKCHGYLGHGGRSRMLHREPHGRYHLGRHSSDVVHKVLDDGLLLLWFGWCPIKHVWDRKMAIQRMIPESDKRMGLGSQHNVTEEQMRAMYGSESQRCVNLMDDCPRYREVIEELRPKRREAPGQSTSAAVNGDRIEVRASNGLVVDGHAIGLTNEFSVNFIDGPDTSVKPVLYRRGQPVNLGWSLAIQHAEQLAPCGIAGCQEEATSMQNESINDPASSVILDPFEDSLSTSKTQEV